VGKLASPEKLWNLLITPQCPIYSKLKSHLLFVHALKNLDISFNKHWFSTGWKHLLRHKKACTLFLTSNLTPGLHAIKQIMLDGLSALKGQ